MAIVTVARECGSGGEDIAKAVAEKLNYDYVSKSTIYAEMEEHGKKWLEWGKELDEHVPSTWERYDQSYAGYLALVKHCIYKAALKNNVVILGRGGNFLLKDIPYALRVRITASVEERAKTLAERVGVNEAEARKMLKYSDHERAIFIKRSYHKDWYDPGEYDLVLNSSHMSADEAVSLIVGEIPARDRAATLEAQETLRRLELASRVKAAIITGFHQFMPTLEVSHDGKEIVLRGVYLFSQERKKALLDIAKRVAAPTGVRSELHFRGA
jgi:cytidylate kinase